MPKRIIYHWVIKRTLEIPDEVPTDDYETMYKYFVKNGLNEYDFLIKEDSRDCEIVDVKNI